MSSGRIDDILKDDIKEYEEDSKAKPNPIGRMCLNELSRHCSFAGEAENNAGNSSQYELSPTEAVNEKSVEEIARHCCEVKKSLLGQLASCNQQGRLAVIPSSSNGKEPVTPKPLNSCVL